MSETRTLTAPLALIKIADAKGKLQPIGKMRNIRITENMRRGRVTGLGEITPSELPALEWSGTVNVGQYAIPNSQSLSQMALDRKFNSTGDFVKHLLFNEGVDISIIQKVKNGGVARINADNVAEALTEESFANIQGFHLTSQGIDISEGQIGGRDATGEYLNPILY